MWPDHSSNALLLTFLVEISSVPFRVGALATLPLDYAIIIEINNCVINLEIKTIRWVKIEEIYTFKIIYDPLVYTFELNSIHSMLSFRFL